MKIGLDIDGVFADFNASFIDTVVAVTGRDLFPPRPFPIPTWNYPEHYGYTGDEVSRAWECIKSSGTFWTTLRGYPGTEKALGSLKQLEVGSHDVYFVTSRPGVVSKKQTQRWLHWHGFDNATVLLSSHKGLIAAGLELDYYIDDRWENALDVAQTKTKSFLLTRPWNQRLDDRTGTPADYGIIEVGSVEEFVKAIVGAL